MIEIAPLSEVRLKYRRQRLGPDGFETSIAVGARYCLEQYM